MGPRLGGAAAEPAAETSSVGQSSQGILNTAAVSAAANTVARIVTDQAAAVAQQTSVDSAASGNFKAESFTYAAKTTLTSIASVVDPTNLTTTGHSFEDEVT